MGSFIVKRWCYEYLEGGSYQTLGQGRPGEGADRLRNVDRHQSALGSNR